MWFGSWDYKKTFSHMRKTRPMVLSLPLTHDLDHASVHSHNHTLPHSHTMLVKDF